MLRFLSKRYSKKRKDKKRGLKISNPILVQHGETNYPTALLNLSSTIPVQRIDSDSNATRNVSPMYGLDSRCNSEHRACVNENGTNKTTSTSISSSNQHHIADKYAYQTLRQAAVKTDSPGMFFGGENINKLGKDDSGTELIPDGETNLHVFHHVRPPRNVIQCRVEMLDGAF